MGTKNYQTARNDHHQNSRDHFLIELAKHDLGVRDLVPNVNFFSKLATSPAGELSFVPNHARPGDFLDLRAELDCLVILTTCHHPMDTSPAYAPKAVQLQLWRADAPASDDYCRTYRPENQRALYNSERFATM